MNFTEWYCWSAEISEQAKKMWFNTFAIDWEKRPWVDLEKDMGELTKEDIPFIPDVIWVSTDCTTYSIAACKTHRFPDKSPRSDYAKICDKTNKHWIKLLKYYKAINPNLVYFIENPRGNLRHMKFMQDFNRHTVWYCKYWDERAKPTDIWTNSTTWKPRPMCRNYKYDKEWNIIDKHCHHISARRWSPTWTQWRKNAYERSKIPKELYVEILKSL